jgi:hypothetical protein
MRERLRGALEHIWLDAGMVPNDPNNSTHCRPVEEQHLLNTIEGRLESLRYNPLTQRCELRILQSSVDP